MIDHNVVRFNISMHDTFAVTEVQSLENRQFTKLYTKSWGPNLQKLVNVIPHVKVGELRI